MKKTYVLRTDDKDFEQAISEFLSKHCKDKDVNVIIYELNSKGANDVMEIVNRT